MFFRIPSLTLLGVVAALTSFAVAQDNHESCAFWADNGECDANPSYMLVNCKTSCDRIAAAAQLGDAAAPTPTSFYEIKERDINGATVDFAQFEGKVVYVVNVASYCGYTESNYQLINQLNNKYANKGLEVVVFPCNQFGAQEPGSGQEITNFAKAKGFSGTIMSKGDVNGDKTRPTFKFLKDRTAKNYITWNFDGKFVVDKTGTPHYIDDNNVDAQLQKYLYAKDL